MWSVSDDLHFRLFSRLLGGPFGRFLIKRFNFFAKRIMKIGISHKSEFTKHIHQHYLKPLDSPASRKGSWVFPKEIIGSSDWLADLWRQRHEIKEKPALMIWGMNDMTFREKELAKFEDLFSNSNTIKLENVGHYVQEDMGEKLNPIILDFMTHN
jgi:haloalkane dehalogenase